MEFNDSTVRDFNINKLKEECFGGDSKSSGGFGLSALDSWGFGGSSGGFGKSGYMLFYERKKKKPLKIVQKTEGEEKVIDVDYEKCVLPEDRPNSIMDQVIKENQKSSFENDVYTKEFFQFNLRIQRSLLDLEYNDQSKALFERGVLSASKTTFVILARTYSN